MGKKFLAIRKLYNLQLLLALFQATNSIMRLNMSWARNFLPIARRTFQSTLYFMWIRLI